MLSDAISGSSSDQVVLALISIIAIAVGALVFVIKNGKVARDTNEQVTNTISTIQDTNAQITQVNRAVNNIGPGDHRLYDKVALAVNELEEVKDILGYVTEEIKQNRVNWKNFHTAWDSLPDGMNNASDLAKSLLEIRGDIAKVQQALAEHVMWEMSKYDDLVVVEPEAKKKGTH